MTNQNFSMVHSLYTHGQSNSSTVGKMADHFKFLILHSGNGIDEWVCCKSVGTNTCCQVLGGSSIGHLSV